MDYESIFPDFSLNDLNPIEREIIKFVSRWNKALLPNTSDIATELNLPLSTVSSRLQRMKEAGIKKGKKESTSSRKRNSDISRIIEWEPHHGVALTEFGKKIAKHIEHHHHVIEFFLHETLDIDYDVAHEESEYLGSNITCKLSNLITSKYNFAPNSWDEMCICPKDAEMSCILTKGEEN